MIFSKSLDHWLVAARKYVLAVSVCMVACATPLFAQRGEEMTPRKVEAKVIFGGAVFGEDIEHKLVGGALRAYVSKRFSIETEYLYLRDSENDQDHLVQPSIVYDFTDPSKRLGVYGIAGGGVLHHKGRFDTTFTTWTASVGVGAKIHVTKRLFISPELRVGREPTVRATINVGYIFGGRR